MSGLIDPRQREAAALLLCAVDLPAPLAAVAGQWLEAGRVCPGFSLDQACMNSRRAALERAAGIVAELLKETTP
jgi:hypothetical protein